jgi:hypothetical protein
MSYDLLSKKLGRRNWAREAGSSSSSLSGITPAKKIALGAMALGTLAGLAFITIPWWKPLPRKRNLRLDPVRGRLFRGPGTPADQIDWSRR